MGPKSAGRKAAASVAAQAASKKKTSALQLSVNDEALVRDALKVNASPYMIALKHLLGTFLPFVWSSPAICQGKTNPEMISFQIACRFSQPARRF